MMGTPRVLHVVEGLGDHLGGLQAAVVAIATAQALGGARVEIVTGYAGDTPPPRPAQLAHDVDVIQFRYPSALARLSGSPAMMRYLRAAIPHCDAVHTHAIWSAPALAASTLAVQNRCRLVVSPHGSLEPYDVQKHKAAKRVIGHLLVRPILNGADAVLCTTAREEDVLTTYGARPHTVVLPVPLLQAPRPTTTRTAYRAARGIPADARVLLFLGRIAPKKGLDRLVSALDRLDGSYHLLVAGAGVRDYTDEIASQVRALDLGKRVHFLGWVNDADKANALFAADAFVLLSENENYGVSVLEAIRAGLPAILTDDVYTAAALVESGSALLSTRDPNTAASTIASLLDDEERLIKMRNACAAYSRESLDVTALSADYARLCGATRRDEATE